MPLLPLLPIFHRMNREFFDGSLVLANKPLLDLKWSDRRLRKTAGFYRHISFRSGHQQSEIVLSRPVLESLPKTALESTLCHEMIHAWVDLVLGVKEVHGPNFRAHMLWINQTQTDFQVSLRHHFPVPPTIQKWWAVCLRCGHRSPYERKVRGAACRKCCNLHFGGKWHSSCLLTYELVQRQ